MNLPKETQRQTYEEAHPSLLVPNTYAKFLRLKVFNGFYDSNGFEKVTKCEKLKNTYLLTYLHVDLVFTL